LGKNTLFVDISKESSREKKHFPRWLPTEKVAILTFQRQDTEFLTQGKKHTEIVWEEGEEKGAAILYTFHLP